jgi:hypothetical protein
LYTAGTITGSTTEYTQCYPCRGDTGIEEFVANYHKTSWFLLGWLYCMKTSYKAVSDRSVLPWYGVRQRQ